MIKAKIIGAGGYGGVGILDLLLGHPETGIAALVDVENAGTSISALYPHLTGLTGQRKEAEVLDAYRGVL